MQTEAPRSMDPLNHTATYTTAVLDPMYEALTGFNQQLQIVPVLGTEWHANTAGTQWTVHLRRGVQFHDGTSLTPATALPSFTRLLDPKRGLAGSTTFRAVVQSVTACGSNDLCFALKTPFAAFASLLAITPLVSPAAEKARTLDGHAVGTGPYRFVEWRTGEHVLEARNDHYWGPKAPFERLRWLWSTESALMNMTLLAREVDVVNPLPPVFAEALRRNRKIHLLEGKSLATYWIALNTQQKPLNDVRVRRALNYATDRDALVHSQLRGYGVPANSPLAPAEFGYDATLQGYPYNPTKAKQLLKECGLESGFTINVAAQEGQVNIVEALAGMWEQIGVHLHIEQMETGVFAGAIFGTPEDKRKAALGGMFASWASQNLDPDHQLGPLYRTENWAPGGANLGFYSNRNLDRLLDQAKAELNDTKRRKLYAQAQQIISNDAPHVLLYYSKDLAAERAGLGQPWLFPGGQLELNGALP
ncbi:MAG: glycosyl transferase [Rhodospirillales bacterium]|nr:glycosyl transferase [Acetobacter sp.]